MIRSKIKNKKMTIDKLATIVAEGFKSTQTNIKGIQTNIKGIQVDIEKLAISTANGFDRIDKKLNQHDHIFNLMIKEIKTIHEDNKYFRQSISGLNIDGLSQDRKIERLTGRVEKLELK